MSFLNVCVSQKEGSGLAGELVPGSMAGCCSSSGMMSMFSRLLFLLRGASLGQWNTIWKRKPRSTACLSTSMSRRASDKRVLLSWQRHSTILYNWPKTHNTIIISGNVDWLCGLNERSHHYLSIKIAFWNSLRISWDTMPSWFHHKLSFCVPRSWNSCPPK